MNRNRLARDSVIVIGTWLYFSGLILLLGAVINAVLGGDASGKSGGVGQRAAEDGTTCTGDETRYEGTLIREESAEYLKVLREDLTGRYEDLRSTDSETGAEQRPQPDSEIEVIEQAQRHLTVMSRNGWFRCASRVPLMNRTVSLAQRAIKRDTEVDLSSKFYQPGPPSLYTAFLPELERASEGFTSLKPRR